METSKDHALQGLNISYENSFSAIKRDICKETVDKLQMRKKPEFEPIEEKPPTSKTRTKASSKD